MLCMLWRMARCTEYVASLKHKHILSEFSLLLVAQKTGYADFRGIMSGFLLACFVGFIAQLIAGFALIVWVPMFYSLIVSILLRIHLAHREEIQECGGCLGECCIGFWCWYCSVTQSKQQHHVHSKCRL
jgi:hypothetical protein